MKFNIWNKWDPLKVVMLGNCYPLEFYRNIKDTKLRDSLLRITEETLEDLDYFENVLKDFGCTVLRCPMNPKDDILNYMNEEGRINFGVAYTRGVNYDGYKYGIGVAAQGVPRSPLQPRDRQLVMGNTLVFTNRKDHPSISIALKKYCDEKHPIMNVNLTEKIIHSGFLRAKGLGLTRVFDVSTLDAPCITVVGNDLYVEGIILDKTDIKKYWNSRINEVSLGGHSDGVFHTLKEGVIISKLPANIYEDSFPGWEVHVVDNAEDNRKHWRPIFEAKINNVREKKYWVPESVDNEEFRNFVDMWLGLWTGDSRATAFDVNVLVLDEHHVCVNDLTNTRTINFLKKHKMEPILIPWRHRRFWDGGLHCITLDLYREGTQQDYFPDRNKSVKLISK